MPLHVKSEHKEMTDEKNQQQVPPAKTDESKNTDNKQEEHTIPKERFDEVNNRAKEAEAKLAALELEKAEKEKKEMEEKQQFKELYGKTETENKRLALEIKKRDLLQEAIINKELHPSLTRMVQGTTEDEIKQSIESAKKLFKEMQDEIKSGKTATDNVPGTKTDTKGVKGVDEWVAEYNKDPNKARTALLEETSAIK